MAHLGRYVLATALVYVPFSWGQSTTTPSRCSASTTTLSVASDVFDLAAACKTFTGDVVVASDILEPSLELDGLEEIDGDFIVDNVTQLVSINSDSLETIRGSFSLQNSVILNRINLENFATVGTLNLVGLPNAQVLSFLQTLQQCDRIIISNTQFNELQGFNLQTVQSVRIFNNPYLESLNLQVSNVEELLLIESNGRKLDVSLPNLQWTVNMTMRNISSINTPSLAQINGTLYFDSTYINDFTSPLLRSVGETLRIMSNSDLANLTLPSLESIGGDLQLQNNTNLAIIDRLDRLATIGGAVNISGPVEQ